MDQYKVLGIHKNASKEEIKQAFRKLAMEFHPDKHSQSPERIRHSATLKFNQVSAAYETLIDDRKRAEYNLGRSAYGAHRSRSYDYNHGDGYSYSNPYGYGYGYSDGSARKTRGGGGCGGTFTRFEISLRYLTTKSFLLNATFVGVLLGGMYVIDASGKALWEMRNHGKSFEEAMESVEKAKARKDGSY